MALPSRYINTLIRNKMVSEIMKFSFHHRAFYCYLIMSLWIFILITAMYKYVGTTSDVGNVKKAALYYSLKSDVKFERMLLRSCNPSDNITRGAEGAVNPTDWLLQGVLAVTRHGDRGPLTHIRSGDTLPCNNAPPSALLKSYEEYVRNASATGRALWVQSPGPFHNFPTLPVHSASTSCALGQLTQPGVLQMLTIGAILKEAYAEKLGWNENAENDAGKQNSGEVVAYSTRYRRTFQSAVALLWALLPARAFPVRAAALRESHSVAFCFHDCACPATDVLQKKISAAVRSRLESHPAIVELVNKVSKVTFETQEHSDPEVLRDALLAYMCHHAPLPCTQKASDQPNADHKMSKLKGLAIKKSENHHQKQLRKDHHVVIRSLLDTDIETLNLELDYLNNQLDFNNEIGRKARDIIGKFFDSKQRPPLDFDAQMEREKLLYYQQRYIDNADTNYEDVVIIKKNLDADFNFHSDGKVENVNNDFDDEAYKDVTPENTEQVCVRKDQLTSLFAYMDWSHRKSMRSAHNRRRGLLVAYGLLHNIVQNMIRMISENKPKFVLYSGHDKTLQALILALGLSDFHQYSVYYASRMVLEVYRKRDLESDGKRKAVAQDFYFRVLFNGVDVTNHLSFCRARHNVVLRNIDLSKQKTVKSYLCPIENIVRFIHDDYFLVFNTSNFKDACASLSVDKKFF